MSGGLIPPGGNGSAASGLSWQSYVLDWTSLASVAIANGANTIDGKIWTSQNWANASTFDILNGTGLRVSPIAATDYNGGSVTLPILKIPLSSLFASIDWMTPCRVSILESDNQAANYDQVYVGIGTTDLTSWTAYGVSGHDSAKSVNRIFALNSEFTASTVSFYNSALTGSANDCMMLDFPGGIGDSSACYRAGTSVGGNFPANSAYKSVSQLRYTSQQTPLYSAGVPQNPGDIVVFLAAVKAGSATAFQAQFKKFKFEWLA